MRLGTKVYLHISMYMRFMTVLVEDRVAVSRIRYPALDNYGLRYICKLNLEFFLTYKHPSSPKTNNRQLLIHCKPVPR